MRMTITEPASLEVEHPEELLDLARGGRLGDGELRELREHLESCPPCALQFRSAGDPMGDPGATRGSDAQLDKRAVHAVLWRLERAPRKITPARASGHRWARLGLGALLLSGTALAATWWSVQRAVREAPAPHLGPPVSSPPSPTAAPTRWRTGDPPPTSATSEDGEDGSHVADPAPPSLREPGPRDLFARARGLRLRGQTREALATYQRLQNAFPESRESHLSHLVTGRIWLERGRFELAVEQFGRYLSVGGSGASEEALVGRATALAGLGRWSQEAGDWKRLLAQHPTSVYAARARARLAALEHSSAVSAP